MQLLPGGPDEGPAIAALEQQMSECYSTIRALEAKTALRPKPSQYEALRTEVLRLVENAGRIASIQELIKRLKVRPAPAFRLIKSSEYFSYSM